MEAEFQELLAGYDGQRGGEDKAVVVRNDYLPERELQTALGPVTVSRLKQVWAVQTKLCVLVIIAANDRREKHFLAIEDGVRESTQSWREVLLKLKSCGMNMPESVGGDQSRCRKISRPVHQNV